MPDAPEVVPEFDAENQNLETNPEEIQMQEN